MTNFLEVALRNARRGFRVMPLKGKEAFLKNWPTVATTDEAQIRRWAAKFSDYNCGIAGGPDIAIVDSDRVGRLKELSGEDATEWFHTYSVSSGRPDRAHFYYRMTDAVREFGNKRWAEPGIDGNVFEVKVQGGQVAAEGSIHPGTGAVYKVTQDLPLIPFPAGLITLIRECYAKSNPTGKREWNLPVHDGEGRDDFLVQQAGKLRHAGASEVIILAHLEELNSDPTIMADPKSDDDLKRIARSVARYDVPAPVPEVVINKPEPVLIEKQPVQNRAVYPNEVWDGTVVGEFAKLCAHDNNIPPKLYAESFRTVLGAVVGNRLSCTVEGAIPRSYSIIIAPFGKGKGTAIRRATRFFNQAWYGTRASSGLTVQGNTPGLLSGCRDFIWKPLGIGAWNASASSVPGMAKLAKDLDETAEKKPQLAWGNTLPRILSVHEEMKTFFSTIYIDGGVGVGMDGVICQLWDDTEFNGTATGTRDALYGQMMFSLLGGVTPDDWFDLISRGNAVGGGLMSRLNLVGTEGGYENVPKMILPDFAPLQESFLPRIKLLADAPVLIRTDEGGERVIAEWADTLPEGSERMNVQCWRSALLLAWLRRKETIDSAIAQDAVRLAQYQVESHEFYQAAAADTQAAKIQAKIVRALTMKGPMPKRELQKQTHAHRCGTDAWDKALTGLKRDERIGQREDGRYFAAE